MPRQPSARSSACEASEALSGPRLAAATNRLVSPLRQRVGVSSTMIVSAGVIAAARPNPTKKRKIARGTKAPVGRNPISPPATPQIKVPVTVCSLRPNTSLSEPQTSAPTMAPTPLPYRISAAWP